ncbi:MAG TPA: TolC family protein, partial [Polyangia bacterium]|nr:TolC family protein [Polyangia bacterium]
MTVRRSLGIAALVCWAAPARADRRLSLADAIALARSHRAEVGQADVDLRRAELATLRAKLERAHLTLDANATEQAGIYRSTGGSAQLLCGIDPTLSASQCAIESHPYALTATLNVPVWSGFTVEAHLAGARANERATEAGRRAALNAIGLDAANAYWEVRRTELALEVARRALDRTQAIERAAKTRVTAGIAPQVDYERAHVSSMRQAEAVNSIESAALVARAQLGAALQVDEPLQLSEDPGAHAPPLPSLSAAIDTAERERPELQARGAVVDAQVQAVRAAKGGYWPQVSLFGQATLGNQDYFGTAAAVHSLAEANEQAVFTALAGVRIDWVFFDTLSTWTAVRDAGFVRDRARLDVERTRYQVRADVQSAHGRLQTALARKTLVADA